MNTQTISTNLAEEEAREIDELSKEIGVDRPALLHQLILRGYREVQIERALQAYRSGHVTLSRAAEIAGLGIRDLLLRFPANAVELNYDVQELKRDMEGI